MPKGAIHFIKGTDLPAPDKLPDGAKIYGVAEVAAAVDRPRNHISVWNGEEPRRNRLPAPTVHLACGPLWVGEEIQEWIRNFKKYGPVRRNSRAMIEA